jgi:Ala-tRNA(Pro) deacylase
MTISPRLSSYLEQSGARYDIRSHAHSRNSAETARLAHVPQHQLAKSVILEDEYGLVQAVVPADTRVQLGALARMLGRSSLRLSDERRLGMMFDDCEVGAVPAFGMLWGLETVVDEDLERNSDIYVECGDHEQLLHLTRMHFNSLMRGVRHGHFTRPLSH